MVKVVARKLARSMARELHIRRGFIALMDEIMQMHESRRTGSTQKLRICALYALDFCIGRQDVDPSLLNKDSA